MAKKRLYVGLSFNESQVREVFRHGKKPEQSDGLPYAVVVGPFRTIKGAKYCAHYGVGNPHATSVRDYERNAVTLETTDGVNLSSLPDRKVW